MYAITSRWEREGKVQTLTKKRIEVARPEIPEDSDEWTPPKKRRTQEK